MPLAVWLLALYRTVTHEINIFVGKIEEGLFFQTTESSPGPSRRAKVQAVESLENTTSLEK